MFRYASLSTAACGVLVAASSLQNSRWIALQIGSRWYRPLLQNMVQHVTVGALVIDSRVERQRTANSEVERGNGVGVFSDVGAQWMVTRNLSLGASYGFSATYGKSTYTAGSDERAVTNTNIVLGPATIRAALYF